jgi:4'-phosphopantetheinyl transferase
MAELGGMKLIAATAPVLAVETTLFQLSAYDADQARQILSQDELARAARFAEALWAQRYIVARAVLRTQLAARIACAPQAVRLTTNAHGKPELADRPAAALGFNLSHSGDFALIVSAPDCQLGCDLEARAQHEDGVAARFFAPAEIAALDAVTDGARADLFTRIWTRKEAVLKAVGLGLGAGLDAFVAPLEAVPHAVEVSFEGQLLSVMDAPAPAGFAAAVAVCGAYRVQLVTTAPPARFRH